MSKSVYGMSEVGDCPRVLAAKKCGHEAVSQTSEDIQRLNHYTALETVAAAQIKDLGYELESSSLCKACKDLHGNERHGIHVEIDSTLFKLVGHLDRRISINGTWYPVEIKSLGKASWTKFRNSQFKAFPGYAGQECAYLEAEGKSGIYWVMERDSGESLKYIVNYVKDDNLLTLTGFTNINLPIDFSAIEDKLNEIEISVQSSVLPLGWENSDSCYFCGYKFLCVKEEPNNDKTSQNVLNPELVEAASDYKYAAELEKMAEDIKVGARASLLQYCKQNNVEKYLVEGISVSYRGQRTKVSIDGKLLEKENPELYRLCSKSSAPYDDYTIKILKDK